MTQWNDAGTRPPTEINAAFVRGFYTHLLAKTTAGTMAQATAQGTLLAFRQFIRHLWRDEIIDLPRNLDDRNLRIAVTPAKVETFALTQLKAIFTTATDRTALYCLLALNCGMTARDIADLHPSEVDWKRGTITRKRSKTKKHADVPTVTYKLWPATLKALRKHRSGNPNQVLVNGNDSPLITQAMRPDGILRRTDTIRLAFRRLIKKIERQGGPSIAPEFTMLRRTGATMLAEQFDNHLTELWLGHSPKTVAGKHYIAPSMARLEQATTWLRTQITP